MSTLVVLVPPRRRASAGSVRADGSDDVSFVLTEDGTTIRNTGRCAPALLPKADSVVAVLGDNDVSWLKVAVPRAPASRMRAALIGVLEERMLDEPEAVHLALEPDATPGEEAWVCAVDKAWLQSEITRLEQSGISVERVVPMSWPEDTPLGHFGEAGRSAGGGTALQLTWSDVGGVSIVPLEGTLARAMLPRWTATPARWSAHPAVAAQAERWLGSPVFVLRDEPRALQAMRSLWNLRQFDLAPAHRGTLALREGWKRFLSAPWRPVRWGLAAFAAINIVGLNLFAWNLRTTAGTKSAAITQVLRDTHPQVRSIIDAPAQMLRETENLRAAAGRLGDVDFESLLSAVAAAWPDGRAPTESINFEPGRLSVGSTGWTEAHVQQFRASLRPGGWTVEQANGVLTVSRGRLPALGS
jgi:general secretion pathway protein L